jgi:hypothetical protein
MPCATAKSATCGTATQVSLTNEREAHDWSKRQSSISAQSDGVSTSIHSPFNCPRPLSLSPFLTPTTRPHRPRTSPADERTLTDPFERLSSEGRLPLTPPKLPLPPARTASHAATDAAHGLVPDDGFVACRLARRRLCTRTPRGRDTRGGDRLRRSNRMLRRRLHQALTAGFADGNGRTRRYGYTSSCRCSHTAVCSHWEWFSEYVVPLYLRPSRTPPCSRS